MSVAKPTADSGSRSPFGSLAEVQDCHAALIREVGNDPLGPGNPDRIADFVRRTLVTGRILDVKEDRAAAQGLVNFWTARLTSAGREAERSDGRRSSSETLQALSVSAPVLVSDLPTFDDTLLDEFDPATLQAATRTADRWIETLSDDDRPLARRILLRLARLATDGDTFEPVPAARATLQDLEASPEKVDEVISRLTDAGVVRVTKGSTAETDQITLRDSSLLTSWETYRRWLKERLAFRQHVISWDRNGRPQKDLYEADARAEARSYGDRNALERQFIDESRRKEIWQNERNRLLKYVFAVLAVVALTGLLCTGISAYMWYLNALNAKRDRDLAKAQEAIAKQQKSIAQEKSELAEERRKVLEDRQRLAEMLSLVRTLAVIGTGSDAEREIAFQRLDAYKEKLSGTPEIGKLFKDEGQRLESIRKRTNSEEDLKMVQIDALNLARVYKNKVLNAPRSVVPDDALQSLKDERDVIFDTVEFCTSEIVKVATSANRPYHDADAYLKEFWVLYWGEMGLVEGKRVQSAMVQFGAVLKQIDKRIADKISPASQKGFTTRQSIQRYYTQALAVAKSVSDGVESAKVDPEKELPKLRERLDALKEAIAAERSQLLGPERPLDASAY